MRAAMRMASLSKTGTIFIMTHDAIGLGEDGPSHQPTEHLPSLRAMPNHDTWRPADSVETGAAYSMALDAKTRPSRCDDDSGEKLFTSRWYRLPFL